jgi:hypothetical protein
VQHRRAAQVDDRAKAAHDAELDQFRSVLPGAGVQVGKWSDHARIALSSAAGAHLR